MGFEYPWENNMEKGNVTNDYWLCFETWEKTRRNTSFFNKIHM